MSTPSTTPASRFVPTAEMITLISVEGLPFLVSELLPKDVGPIRKIFQDIIQNHTQSVSKVANSQFRVLVTKNNTNEKDYETVLQAVSTVLSTTEETRQRRETLAGRTTLWTPLVGEGFSLVSDMSSAVRNGIDAANKTNVVAKATLGTIGGAANVVVGGLIVQGAVEQYNTAAVANDDGGRAEAVLTGIMGFSLAVVGLAMLLYFSGAIGAPFLFTAAFAMYAIIGARCVYIVDYLREFRSGLTQILESQEYEDDQRKLQAALAYLESYTATPELRNKLARRVGAECALDLETRLPTLIRRVGTGDLKEAQELVQQVLEANRELIAKQVLLFAIATIGVLTYTAGLGVGSLFSDLTVSKLSVVLNVLWLFVDHQAMSVKGWSLSKVWSKLTRKAHDVYTRNMKHWKGTKMYPTRTKSLIRVSQSHGGRLSMPTDLVSARRLQEFRMGDETVKASFMEEAIKQVVWDVFRGVQIVINGRIFLHKRKSSKDWHTAMPIMGKRILKKLKKLDPVVRFALLDNMHQGFAKQFVALTPAECGYNQIPNLQKGHRMGVRIPPATEWMFDVNTNKKNAASFTIEMPIKIISRKNTDVQTDNDEDPTTILASKTMEVVFEAPSMQLTATFS